MLLTDRPATLIPTTKVYAITSMMNDNDPDWHYIARPLSSENMNQSYIVVFDEDWNEIGTL